MKLIIILLFSFSGISFCLFYRDIKTGQKQNFKKRWLLSKQARLLKKSILSFCILFQQNSFWRTGETISLGQPWEKTWDAWDTFLCTKLNNIIKLGGDTAHGQRERPFHVGVKQSVDAGRGEALLVLFKTQKTDHTLDTHDP